MAAAAAAPRVNRARVVAGVNNPTEGLHKIVSM